MTDFGSALDSHEITRLWQMDQCFMELLSKVKRILESVSALIVNLLK